jgi:hypothetical protein
MKKHLTFILLFILSYNLSECQILSSELNNIFEFDIQNRIFNLLDYQQLSSFNQIGQINNYLSKHKCNTFIDLEQQQDTLSSSLKIIYYCSNNKLDSVGDGSLVGRIEARFFYQADRLDSIFSTYKYGETDERYEMKYLYFNERLQAIKVYLKDKLDYIDWYAFDNSNRITSRICKSPIESGKIFTHDTITYSDSSGQKKIKIFSKLQNETIADFSVFNNDLVIYKDFEKKEEHYCELRDNKLVREFEDIDGYKRNHEYIYYSNGELKEINSYFYQKYFSDFKYSYWHTSKSFQYKRGYLMEVSEKNYYPLETYWKKYLYKYIK